jgi:cellobiose phosphorylase
LQPNQNEYFDSSKKKDLKKDLLSNKKNLFDEQSLQFYNQWGGFSKEGTEYHIHLRQNNNTPLPWVNVIANPQFGTVVSERGSSYSWFENAHEYRLSPWFNDSILDTTGEKLFLLDEMSGNRWSPFPQTLMSSNSYIVKHGFGYSEFEHSRFGLYSKVTVYVAPTSSVKFVLVELQNNSKQSRLVTMTYSVELTLAERQNSSQDTILTDYDSKSGTLIARNPMNIDFSQCISFLKVTSSDKNLSFARSDSSGFALQGKQLILTHGKSQICFILGASNSVPEVQNLVEKFGRISSAYRTLNLAKESWKNDLTTIQISTGDPSVDVLCNGWLLYQTMSSRVYGRSGFYQSGGAYGFRDQLQDAMALVYSRPDLLREQILKCASVQFQEGDVLHWWHPPSGRGVRTHITDDLLWLPYALSRYIKVTGDRTLLDESVAFVEGSEVALAKESEYYIPTKSIQVETVYDHCVKAILKSFQFGKHGLPLMGGGDWNDGMNEVGHHGRGESVWLAFFLHEVLSEFSDIANLKKDMQLIDKMKVHRDFLSQNIEKQGWDGAWYRRAYFDEGYPLGTIHSAECQIDLLPQCWSVLANVGSRERMKTAMNSVVDRLIDEKNGLIRLLDPPFEGKHFEPGYIKGYIPGTRENGAQYTHAAVWTVMAFVKLGLPDQAWKYFLLINPIHHGSTLESIETYKVEPYVVAADIYSKAPYTGRGGWTWYTGSAAWMYRLIIESFIGLELKEGRWISFKPCLPSHINNVLINYKFGQTQWKFQLIRTSSEKLETNTNTSFELIDDGQAHHIQIFI